MADGEGKSKVKRGLWTPEEDSILREHVETFGEGNWAIVSRRSGLKRGAKSCRLRWKNYLRPNIKRGEMSEEEEDLIMRMHKLLGNRWSLIAGRLPGRTDNEIKNYWNTHLNRKCRQFGKKKTAGNCLNNHKSYTEDDKKRRSEEDARKSPPGTHVDGAALSAQNVAKNDHWMEELGRWNCGMESPLLILGEPSNFVTQDDTSIDLLEFFPLF